MIDFEFKKQYGFGDLCKITELLRSENGCPWDREQTHKSIRKNLIEETYEVVEAIDKSDNTLMCEELGDLLLQVIFHSCMAKEEGAFDIDDVSDGICKKLILRHPHIFSTVKADSSEQVLANWDDIKQKEKGNKLASESMDGISSALPALMRAYKVGQKAAKVDFDFPTVSDAITKVREELDELEQAIKENSPTTDEELGDVLFACVNVARKLKSEPEERLYFATDKFVNRFKLMEQYAKGEGKSLTEYTLEQKEELWIKAKQQSLIGE